MTVKNDAKPSNTDSINAALDSLTVCWTPTSGQLYLLSTLGLLVSKHYQINQSQLGQGPLAFLSERERQVCEAACRGKKAKWSLTS